MARPFAIKFYHSKAWKTTRTSYISKVNGLCERCLEQGRYKPCIDVHHKILLTPLNINDPNISLNQEHLIALCKECHNTIHGNGSPIREDVMFDEQGQLVRK